MESDHKAMDQLGSLDGHPQVNSDDESLIWEATLLPNYSEKH